MLGMSQMALGPIPASYPAHHAGPSRHPSARRWHHRPLSIDRCIPVMNRGRGVDRRRVAVETCHKTAVGAVRQGWPLGSACGFVTLLEVSARRKGPPPHQWRPAPRAFPRSDQ